MADLSGTFEVDGLVKTRKELEALLTTSPEMEKKVQKIVRTVLSHVRKDVTEAAKGAMRSDLRKAYQAVKTTIYRQILGGNVSILNKKKRGTQFSAYEPPRKLRPKQRGGNRVPRSERTKDLLHYAGPDRAFVLRFINAGTEPRYIGGRNGSTREKRDAFILKHEGRGYRGRIAPRNFFGPASHAAMRKAVAELQQYINELIKQEIA